MADEIKKGESIEMDAELVEEPGMEESHGEGYAPAARGTASDLQKFNDDIDGLDDFQSWLPRVALQNTGGFLYKQGPKKDQIVQELAVRIDKGQKCLEYFDEATQTYATSYDGITSTQGEPWSIYANLKDKNGKPAVRKKLELEWEEDHPQQAGEKIRYLISLSPTSAGAFKEYSDKLKRLCGKRVREVVTYIKFKPQRNRQGQAYNTCIFSCLEIDDAEAKSKGK